MRFIIEFDEVVCQVALGDQEYGDALVAFFELNSVKYFSMINSR